jgi:hypothetical protein
MTLALVHASNLHYTLLGPFQLKSDVAVEPHMRLQVCNPHLPILRCAAAEDLHVCPSLRKKKDSISLILPL